MTLYKFSGPFLLVVFLRFDSSVGNAVPDVGGLLFSDFVKKLK